MHVYVYMYIRRVKIPELLPTRDKSITKISSDGAQNIRPAFDEMTRVDFRVERNHFDCVHTSYE